MLKGTWGSGEDHGRSHFIAYFKDRLDRLGVVNVEGGYGVAFFLCIQQEIFCGNNAHITILLGVPGMNNNALYNAVHSAAGRRRIRCIADVNGLRQSKDLGVNQEAER